MSMFNRAEGRLLKDRTFSRGCFCAAIIIPPYIRITITGFRENPLNLFSFPKHIHLQKFKREMDAILAFLVTEYG